MSDWLVEERPRTRRAGERIHFPKTQAGDVRVCLVYPNRYPLAMGNLGFQTDYELFDRHPGVLCERAFLPDQDDLPIHERSGVPVLSLESQRPLRDFDCVAFSTTYENDYLNLLHILALSGIPVRAGDRGPGDPFVSMGGVCAWANPEPLADFIDWFFLGEGEESGPEAFALWQRVRDAERDPESARVAFFRALLKVEGAYVPRCYDVRYHADDGVTAGLGIGQAVGRHLHTTGSRTRV